MRNLKRAFSLVLALVMVLGMITVVPVAAADETSTMVTSNFTDAAEINPDYMESVAITGGIGLFAGADGKFMPKGTVTRAQMATIIVKMLYGGDINADSFKGNGKFSDTASFEGGWAEGYINWCSTLGIVAGYGDGTFRPGNQVTTAEAATMILNALKIDAGAGTWPNTVMAKAEEEGLFEDLKPMPGTNTALTREELSVIALNGLNWTATDDTGWYVSGGTADSKMTFDSYKDAQKYADKVGGKVEPLEGRDSLANKVYDLKKAEGFITANQATGEKYTEVTVNWDPVATAKFNVATDAGMVGHKVTIWYEEQYKSEREPGKTYSVSEAAEYITLNEDAESAKDYKAAFGTKYDLQTGMALTSGTGYVTAGSTIAGYVANSAAPAGTYVIDIETGALCGYIAPKTYTAAKVGYVDSTAENENILVGSLSLSNTAEDDQVVEYDGIAKDDYVVYYQMQGVYVLTKLEEVTGSVTKIDTNKKGQKVVTLDGSKEYTQSTATGSIVNTLTASALTSGFDYKQTYTFYLDPAGNFVCFEKVEGGAFDMANTFYVLGVMQRTEADNYGKTSTTYFARGVDMTGNEAMVPIGIKKAGQALLGTDTIEGGANFYSVKDATGTEEKKENLKVLVAFPNKYNPDDPTATYVYQMNSYGQTGADWQEGGKFEYGVSEQLANNGTFEAGVYCYNHKATKYIVVEGTVDQNQPLETSVSTGSGTFKFAKNVPITALFTRQANGTNNIEAMVFPMSVDHALNGTMIYVSKGNTTPAGTDAIGNVYNVYNGTTGEAMEMTFSADLDTIPVGYYSVGYDADEEIYKLAVDGEGTPIAIPAATTETIFEQRDRTDGRYFESVVYDVDLTAFTGSTLWFTISGTTICSSSCSGVKVVDVRTDEQVAKDGVARITTLDQVWAMKDSMPWVTIELDMCHTYSPSKVVTAFVEVYNNREYGIGNLVYADAYNDTKVIVVDGEIDGMGKIINLPEGVVARKPGFYYLNASGEKVVLSAATDLDTVSKVALNGNVAGLSGYEIFNATDIEALNTLSGFAGYEAVEYQLLNLESKNTTVILVMGAGDKVASGTTAEKLVSAAEYDSVVDTTGNGITLENLESKQGTLCIAYDAYELNGGRMLLVATGTDAGTLVNTKAALDAISSATVTNTTDANFSTLAQLKSLVASGYTFSAKLYNLPGGDVLVVSMCMNAASVDGALSASSFGSDKVVLTGNATLSGTITVPAGENWLLDLNGNTLSGSAATYFVVSAGAKLTIQDSSNGGKIKGTQGAGAMFKVEGDLVLNGGELCDHDNTNAAVYGGAIVLNKKDATFTMNGGVIRNNKSAGRGGAVGTQDGLGGTTITINGGEIVDNIADRGNNIYTQSTVTFIMTGGTIGQGLELDGTVAATENIWMRNTTIEISGASKITGLGPDSTCTMNLANLADGAYIQMTRTDAVVTKDATVSQSGTVYTNSAAAGGGLTFKVVQPANGTIALSPATAELGDTVTVTATPATGYELKTIYVDGNAIVGNTFTVTKEHRITAEFALKSYDIDLDIEGSGTATLSSDTAKMGETVTITATAGEGMELNYIKVNGEALADGVFSFTMPAEDVTVEVKFGAHPYNISVVGTPRGTFTFSAEGNKATAGTVVTVTLVPDAGWGLHSMEVTGFGTVTTTSTSIAGTHTYTFTMPAYDVYVNSSFIQGVNKVRANASDLPSNYIVEDNEFGVTTENIESKLATNDINFTKYGKVVVVTAVSEGKSTALTTKTGTLAAGKYYLDGNLALTGSLTTSGNVTIDLNGYTLSGAVAPYVTVASGSSLTIADSVGGGKVQGMSAANSMIKVNGTLILNSGALTGHTNTSGDGGAVYVAKGGTFTMNGGTISNNKLTGNKWGAGVYLEKSASGSARTVFNMTGGLITGNWNPYRGGGVSTQENAADSFMDINISGGEISGNGAGNRAGNLHVFGAKVTITGGTFGVAYTNEALSTVGTGSHTNVEFRGFSKATISGGTFELIGTQGNNSSWELTFKGTAVVKSLIQSGINSDTNDANDNKISIVELESGASVKLGANVDSSVPVTTDSTVKVTGEAGKAHTVYSYKG